MTRKEEILKYIKENRPNEVDFLLPLVDDVVFLEGELEKLRELPLIEIHPTDRGRQRTTPSAKLYKELLQQYNNCLKIIILKTGSDDGDEGSPLRIYMDKRNKEKR